MNQFAESHCPSSNASAASERPAPPYQLPDTAREFFFNARNPPKADPARGQAGPGRNPLYALRERTKRKRTPCQGWTTTRRWIKWHHLRYGGIPLCLIVHMGWLTHVRLVFLGRCRLPLKWSCVGTWQWVETWQATAIINSRNVVVSESTEGPRAR